MNTRSLIRLWGVTDLACALTLLNIIDVPIFNNMQETIFVDPQDLLSIRAFACFVLLNSVIRMSFNQHKYNKLVSFSYFLEFYVYLTEVVVYKTMNESNLWFCSLIVCLTMTVITYKL